MWQVTYDDGSTEEFEDMTLELVCAYIDDRKMVMKIEWKHNKYIKGEDNQNGIKC